MGKGSFRNSNKGRVSPSPLGPCKVSSEVPFSLQPVESEPVPATHAQPHPMERQHSAGPLHTSSASDLPGAESSVEWPHTRAPSRPCLHAMLKCLVHPLLSRVSSHTRAVVPQDRPDPGRQKRTLLHFRPRMDSLSGRFCACLSPL